MLNRFKNALTYGYKGAAHFAPFGSVAAGIMIGVYYWVKYIQFDDAKYNELMANGAYNCSSEDPGCRLHYHTVGAWHVALKKMSQDYATMRAQGDLSVIWPYFVIPAMTVGLAGGAIYGFFLPVKEELVPIEFSDNEDPNCPPEFIDPVFYNRMRNPYALDCGGNNHNLDYGTLQRLEPNVKSQICCPLCRGVIKEPHPNDKLKDAIDIYVKNRTKNSVKAIADDVVVTSSNTTETAIEITTAIEDMDNKYVEIIDSSRFDKNNADVVVDIDTILNDTITNQIESYPELATLSIFANKKINIKVKPDCSDTITNTKTNSNGLSS